MSERTPGDAFIEVLIKAREELRDARLDEERAKVRRQRAEALETEAKMRLLRYADPEVRDRT